MDGIATHDHSRVLRVCQERYRAWIGDGVNATQFDINLEANVCEILGFSLLALMALQTLSCYSGLKGVISQGEKIRAKMVAHMNITKAVGELSWRVGRKAVRHLLFNGGIDV